MKALLLAALIVFSVSGLAQSPLSCNSPYKGKTFTQASIQPILKAHDAWLSAGAKDSDDRRANLCGTILTGLNLNGKNLSGANFVGADMSQMQLKSVNFSGANLFKAYFLNSNLKNSNLENTNLKSATLKQANLQGANLRRAMLNNANLSSADLSAADLRGANLTGANLSDANLSNGKLNWAIINAADLSHANLSGAVLENARLRSSNLSYANLTNANLSDAKLQNTNLTKTIVTDANFTRVDFKNATFQPALGGLPNLIALATSQHFSSLHFSGTEGVAALIELRSAYKKLGIRSMERQITAMVKTQQMRNTWQRGGWGYLEAAVSYVFFYVTSDFGASPGRPLRILLILIFVFAVPYWFVLFKPSRRRGIIVTWYSKRFSRVDKVRNPEERKELSMVLQKRHVTGFFAKLREQWRLIKMALFFSVISSFSIGWRELNVSNWILKLQSRASFFKANGWVRILAGLQSILSVYLVVLWVLTYFGSPFEW